MKILIDNFIKIKCAYQLEWKCQKEVEEVWIYLKALKEILIPHKMTNRIDEGSRYLRNQTK